MASPSPVLIDTDPDFHDSRTFPFPSIIHRPSHGCEHSCVFAGRPKQIFGVARANAHTKYPHGPAERNLTLASKRQVRRVEPGPCPSLVANSPKSEEQLVQLGLEFAGTTQGLIGREFVETRRAVRIIMSENPTQRRELAPDLSKTHGDLCIGHRLNDPMVDQNLSKPADRAGRRRPDGLTGRTQGVSAATRNPQGHDIRLDREGGGRDIGSIAGCNGFDSACEIHD